MGKFKSHALADRLARAYGRPIGYSVHAFREGDSGSYGHRYAGLPRYGNCLLIGCTDNAAARRAMAACLRGGRQQWLIDAGNDANWGQVLVGNMADPSHRYESAFDGETCYLLPAPTLQRPDLLTTVPTTPPDVDCAAALDLTDQDPTINQMMASLVLMVVRRMVAGACSFMGALPGHGTGHRRPYLRHPGGGGAGDEVEPPRAAKDSLTPWTAGRRPNDWRSRLTQRRINEREKPCLMRIERKRPARMP